MLVETKQDICLVLINLKCVFFTGILLLTGYNMRPRCKIYWKNCSDVRNESISIAMLRNRVEEIMSMPNNCRDNNQLDVDDKVSKMRPLNNFNNQRCQRF